MKTNMLLRKYVHRLKLMPKDDLNYMQLCQDEKESTNAQNVYFRANQWMNWPLFWLPAPDLMSSYLHCNRRALITTLVI